MTGVVPIWSVAAKIEGIDKIKGYLVHVLFPENKKRYGYQQSFNSKDLILLKK